MQEFIVGSKIYTVDALYSRPLLAAIHIIHAGDEVALVDTGTQFSVPQIEDALQQLGLGFDAVRYILLTHIHLDHAGGASKLMQLCANATLVVHKKGARHMADPSKLIAGSIAVYGEQEFAKLYGEIEPIDADRIISPEEGETILMGEREFLFLDTPGHASHHYCIVDKATNSVFTGDTLGLGYVALRDPEHAFMMPTTTPVQFNPQALHDSIDKVMALKPDYLYLTHYSAVKPSARNIAGLHEQIDDFVMLTQQASEAGDQFEHDLSQRLLEYVVRRASNELESVDESTIAQWVKLDSGLSAQGLAYWWQHRRAA